MKNPIKIALFIAIIAFSSLSCQLLTSVGPIQGVRGSGNVVTESLPVSGINRVEVANQGDLYIEFGDQEGLVVEAEDNLMQYLNADTQNGKLTFETRPQTNLRNTKPIKYHLTVKELDSIETSSSGDIYAPAISADSFSILISSSGNVEVDAVNANNLQVMISSSGDVHILGGEATEQDITLSSSGNYDAQEMSSQRANVKLSSSGDATIQVQEQLDANLTSSGNLYYEGNPQTNVHESSSGNVYKR